MPPKNSLKKYQNNSFYHIYNRGVNKTEIFKEKEDYKVFLNYLKSYLLPKEISIQEIKKLDIDERIKATLINDICQKNNFFNKIKIYCFVLMKNHFHFLIWQKDQRDIADFMRSLFTRYTKYFHLKYGWVGPLFQSRYKGILIDKEDYFLHLSRYIHTNPKEILNNQLLEDYPWSSYPAYLGKVNYLWLEKDLILSYFKNIKGYEFNSYQGFVEGCKDNFLNNYWEHL